MIRSISSVMLCACALVVISAVNALGAQDPGTPEIDAGSMAAAVALLAAGGAFVADRVRRKFMAR